MWIFTTTGFYTVAENTKDRNTVLVRARVKKDLEDFRDVYVRPDQDAKITYHETYDYPYRMILPKNIFAEAMALTALDVNYPKFKEAVAKRQGRSRANFYTMLWGHLTRLEENPDRIKQYFDRQHENMLTEVRRERRSRSNTPRRRIR
jgi:hypothetical protein